MKKMSLTAHFFSGFIFLIQPLFNSKESKFKVNVLKLNKIDKIRNFDIYEI